MKFYTVIATTAAMSLWMASQANATPMWPPLNYTSTIVFSGAVDGGGGGGGTGVFDFSGLLTIESFWAYNIPVLGVMATTVDTTLLEGIITGNSWTGTGTGTAILHSCVGSALICDQLTVGMHPITPRIFSLDTNTGGTWTYSNLLAGGAITMTVTDELTPRQAPVPTTLWLCCAAALAALAGRGRKQAST